MLNDTIIVQTAASAFNNAALIAPAFLWWGILSLPLFWITYLCAGTIMTRMGWTAQNIIPRATTATVILSIAWLVLFGGNYGILRDGVSALPALIAAILFVGAMFISSHTKSSTAISKKQKIIISVLIIIALGATGANTWWGPLLQIAAPGVGILVGRAARTPMRPIAGTLLIILAITTAIMMQPEFFRFGKLGELTLMHITFILLTGAAAMATLALHNIRPRGRIHHGAYVKLKWMLRFICALGVVLIFMTESVPVLLGTLAALFVLFALSVYHAQAINPNLPTYMFAVTIGLFGIITTIPVITAVAMLLCFAYPIQNLSPDIRRLL